MSHGEWVRAGGQADGCRGHGIEEHEAHLGACVDAVVAPDLEQLVHRGAEWPRIEEVVVEDAGSAGMHEQVSVALLQMCTGEWPMVQRRPCT